MVQHFPGIALPQSIEAELRSPSARDRLDDLAVPNFARLEIPLKDANSLRRFADVLRGLANSLDLYSRVPEANLYRDKNEAEYRALLDAFHDIKAANVKISGRQERRRATKSGK